MKKLQLRTQEYEDLLNSYKQWLHVLNYATTTVNNLPVHAKEFLHYLETTGTRSITELTQEQVNKFIEHIKSRSNQRTSGGLSICSINKIILSIILFIKFLNNTSVIALTLNIKRFPVPQVHCSVLNKEEVQKLYLSAETDKKEEVRDKAILTILYACGLRKNEAEQLKVKDINTRTKFLHVAKGKGGKSRNIPLTDKSIEYIVKYLNTKTAQSVYFFSNNQGSSMSASVYYSRIRVLKERAGIEKRVSLHTLRHSIATHLLQNGMELENIKKFLGHASLESTQIYTHIINEL